VRRREIVYFPLCRTSTIALDPVKHSRRLFDAVSPRGSVKLESPSARGTTVPFAFPIGRLDFRCRETSSPRNRACENEKYAHKRIQESISIADEIVPPYSGIKVVQNDGRRATKASRSVCFPEFPLSTRKTVKRPRETHRQFQDNLGLRRLRRRMDLSIACKRVYSSLAGRFASQFRV
jgi:hypothetical protein